MLHQCTSDQGQQYNNVDREISLLKYFRSCPQPRKFNAQNSDNFYGQPRVNLRLQYSEFTCAALMVLQVLRFFKAADGLSDLKRSLSLSVPSRGIASENREVLDSTNCGPKRKGRSTGCTGDTEQPRRTLCRYVSDDGIAAARSYVSILDTMIAKKFFVDELNYENLTPRKIYAQNIFNTKISRSTVIMRHIATDNLTTAHNVSFSVNQVSTVQYNQCIIPWC